MTDLSNILKGKIVVPENFNDVYITPDINDPSKYIFIPFSSQAFLDFSILTNFEEKLLVVPGEHDRPVTKKCVICDNRLFTEDDFVFVEEANCWAYYPKS